MKRFAGVSLLVAGVVAMLSLGTASADSPLRSTSTSVTCAAAVVGPEQPDTCTASVADTDTGTATVPTGTVEFSMAAGGGSSGPPTCTLAAGSCQFTYPGWDRQGIQTITATYEGDSAHAGSSGTTNVEVFFSPPPCCFVPRVKGEKLRKAKATLRRYGFSAGRIDRSFSKRVHKGRVIAQRPRRGKLVPLHARITLVVSKGKRHARP
jgi:PASTA domain-containing protein/Big-like domain-containing protein